MTDESKYTGIAGLLTPFEVELISKANQDKGKLREAERKIRRIKNNLAKGNPAAALSKSKKSEAQIKQQREWAIDVFRVHPFWRYDQVAEEVFRIVTVHHKMVNGKPYELSTVRKAIQGTREEAAKKFSETSK